MNLSIDQLASRIFVHLRRMDEEAKTEVSSGVRAGLNDYGRHVCPNSKRQRAEVEWSRSLAQYLSEDGVPTSREVKYPIAEGRQSCDLVVSLANDARCWIEVKGAWRDYWNGKGIYLSYLLHPLKPGLDKSKTHTVPFDLLKLSQLAPPEADFVGQLVVGFERPSDPMDNDINTLVSLARLSEWREFNDSWMSPTVVNQRVRIWFWSRPTTPKWCVPGLTT